MVIVYKWFCQHICRATSPVPQVARWSGASNNWYNKMCVEMFITTDCHCLWHCSEDLVKLCPLYSRWQNKIHFILDFTASPTAGWLTHHICQHAARWSLELWHLYRTAQAQNYVWSLVANPLKIHGHDNMCPKILIVLTMFLQFWVCAITRRCLWLHL